MNHRSTFVHTPSTAISTSTEAAPLPGWAATARYAALRTFRRNGTGIDAPIWFAVDGSGLVIRTPTATAKVRRLVADPRVELRACDWKGRLLDGPILFGTAEILDRPDAIAIEPVLRRRYGWQWNWVPMIPVPGVKSAHGGTPLRRRLELARATELWDESCIIRISPVASSPTRG